MTVTGDKGKIGTADLVDKLMNDTDFKRMFAYELAKAKAEIDSH